MSDKVRLQDLLNFTVQIRHATKSEQIVGTGVVVSTDGKIVTCVHVVRAAGVEPRGANGAQVRVYFPRARGGETKKRRARVKACFPEHDDVVVLQLVGGGPPLGPEQIAVLGTSFGGGQMYVVGRAGVDNGNSGEVHLERQLRHPHTRPCQSQGLLPGLARIPLDQGLRR